MKTFHSPPFSYSGFVLLRCLLPVLALCASGAVAAEAAGVRLTGELKQWHKVTVELAGPTANETDTAPNPFTDYRFDVTFTHGSGSPSYTIPGYFAADGNSANSSAKSGRVWRAHFAPDKTGTWNYRVAFTRGRHVAMEGGGECLAPFDGSSGNFTIAPTDKTGADFRTRGRLEYVGKHHLRFAGSGEYFLKAGPDSPETLLAYADFDDTTSEKKDVPLKTWRPHERDWREGDPTWAGGKGKGLIGAINYLASEKMNTMSFLPYNAGGDGDNVCRSRVETTSCTTIVRSSISGRSCSTTRKRTEFTCTSNFRKTRWTTIGSARRVT